MLGTEIPNNCVAQAQEWEQKYFDTSRKRLKSAYANALFIYYTHIADPHTPQGKTYLEQARVWLKTSLALTDQILMRQTIEKLGLLKLIEDPVKNKPKSKKRYSSPRIQQPTKLSLQVNLLEEEWSSKSISINQEEDAPHEDFFSSHLSLRIFLYKLIKSNAFDIPLPLSAKFIALTFRSYHLLQIAKDPILNKIRKILQIDMRLFMKKEEELFFREFNAFDDRLSEMLLEIETKEHDPLAFFPFFREGKFYDLVIYLLHITNRLSEYSLALDPGVSVFFNRGEMDAFFAKNLRVFINETGKQLLAEILVGVANRNNAIAKVKKHFLPSYPFLALYLAKKIDLEESDKASQNLISSCCQTISCETEEITFIFPHLFGALWRGNIDDMLALAHFFEDKKIIPAQFYWLMRAAELEPPKAKKELTKLSAMIGYGHAISFNSKRPVNAVLDDFIRHMQKLVSQASRQPSEVVRCTYSRLSLCLNKENLSPEKILAVYKKTPNTLLLEAILKLNNKDRNNTEEARILLARQYKKEGKYESARTHFYDCIENGYEPTPAERTDFNISQDNVVSFFTLAYAKRLIRYKQDREGINQLSELLSKIEKHSSTPIEKILLKKLYLLLTIAYTDSSAFPEANKCFCKAIKHGHLITNEACIDYHINISEISDLLKADLKTKTKEVLAIRALTLGETTLAVECLGSSLSLYRCVIREAVVGLPDVNFEDMIKKQATQEILSDKVLPPGYLKFFKLELTHIKTLHAQINKFTAEALYELFQHTTHDLHNNTIAADFKTAAVIKANPALNDVSPDEEYRFQFWQTANDHFEDTDAAFELFLHYLFLCPRDLDDESIIATCMDFLFKAAARGHSQASTIVTSLHLSELVESFNLQQLKTTIRENEDKYRYEIFDIIDSPQLNDISKILFCFLSIIKDRTEQFVSVIALENTVNAYHRLQSNKYDDHTTDLTRSIQYFILHLANTNQIYDTTRETFAPLFFAFSLKEAILKNTIEVTSTLCETHRITEEELDDISKTPKEASSQNLRKLARYVETKFNSFDLVQSLELAALQTKNPDWSPTPDVVSDVSHFYQALYDAFHDNEDPYRFFEHFVCLSDFEQALYWLKIAVDCASSHAWPTKEKLKLKEDNGKLELPFDSWRNTSERINWSNEFALPSILLYQYLRSRFTHHVYLKNKHFISSVARNYVWLLTHRQHQAHHPVLKQAARHFFIDMSAGKYLTEVEGLREIFMAEKWYSLALLSDQQQAETVIKTNFTLPYSDKIATLLSEGFSNKCQPIIKFANEHQHPYLTLFFMMSPNKAYPKHLAQFFNPTPLNEPTDEDINHIKNFLNENMGIELDDKTKQSFLKSLYKHLPGALFQSNDEDMIDLALLFKQHKNVFAHLYWMARATEKGNEKAKLELLDIFNQLAFSKEGRPDLQKEETESTSETESQLSDNSDEIQTLPQQLLQTVNKLVRLTNHSMSNDDKKKYAEKTHIVVILIRRVFREHLWFKEIPDMSGNDSIFPYTLGTDITEHFEAFKTHLETHKVFHYGAAQRERGPGRFSVARDVGPQNELYSPKSPRPGMGQGDNDL